MKIKSSFIPLFLMSLMVLCTQEFEANPGYAQDLFGEDSHIIIHPLFTEYIPGFVKTYVGFGLHEGDIFIERVDRYEQYNDVQCIVVEELESDQGYNHIWMAQDLSGNVRILKIEGYEEDEGLEIEDYSQNPLLFMPADLVVGGVITEEGSDQVRTILSVNLSLPENEHGMGPYEGCVEIENVETTDVGEAYGRDFYAPGIGEVADWEDEPNLRGHKISDVQFAESDAPTPTPTPTFFSLPTPTATPDPSDHLTDMIDGIPIIDSFHRISTSMSWDDDDNVSTDYLLDQEDQDPIIFVNYGPYVFDGSEPLRYLNMPVISIFNSCGLEIENFFMAIRIFPRSNDNEEHVPDRTFSRSIFGGATRDGTSGVPDDITLSSTSKTIEKRVIDDLDTYIIPLTGVLSANEILIFDLQFDRGEEIHNLIYETAFFGIHTDADVRDPIYTYTMDGSTDEENNLLVIYPEGYQLGNYSYGEFDVSEGEEEYTNGFGLKANLEPGKGVTVFGKPLTVDPETYIFLRISASCSDPRAEIAVGALDAESAEYLEDAKLNGSIGSNLLRVSTRFVNHFEYLETLYLRERTAIVPVFQAVNSSGVGSIQVQFDNLEIYAIPRAQLLTR